MSEYGENGYTVARFNGSCWWPIREKAAIASGKPRIFPSRGFEEAVHLAAKEGNVFNDGEELLVQYMNRNGTTGGATIIAVKAPPSTYTLTRYVPLVGRS